MNLDSLKEYKDHVPLLAQGFALVGLVVVGCGFLSLTIYHASLGIPQISFIRPKIVSTGLLLVGIAASALIPAIYYSVHKPKPSDNLKQNFLHNLILFESFVVGVAVTSSLYIRPYFGGWGDILDSRLKWVGLAVIVPVLLDSYPFTKSWPLWKYVVRSILVLSSISFGLVRVGDKVLAVLILWLLACGYSVFLTHSYLREPAKFNYVQIVLTGLGVVGLFGQYIFRNIPASVCGGAPVPATITFADKQPPIGTSPQLKVWLIDETDAGYYFLQTKASKKALYIPRAGVSLISYGE